MTPAQLYRWRKERQVVTVEGGRQVITAPSVLWMWAGAVTSTAATVVARVNSSTSVRLVVSLDDSFASPTYSDAVESANGVAKLSVTGLIANTRYYYGVEAGGRLSQDVGTFRTLPSASAASFRCAFAGDASTGSNHAVFGEILERAPLFFVHMGDLHYQNISTNDPTAFRAAYDAVFASARQAKLYRSLPIVYTWDDHDFGADDSDASSASKSAAAAVYRERVPHYPLEHGTAIYHSFTVGRVVFIVTDLRSQASAKNVTDNASKTMLGDEQKTWMKSVITDNPDKFFVWVCSRTFGGGPTAGSDRWAGFSTERTELGEYFAANCPGRICVISADMHALAIDDGSNHTFGGEAIPTFQAAPLDRMPSSGNPITFSEGGPFLNTGQFGVMDVTDTGGEEIIIDWTGYKSDGAVLVRYRFTANLSET